MKNFLSLVLMALFCVIAGIADSQTILNSQVQISYTNPDNLKACAVGDTLVVLADNVSGQPIDPGSVLNIDFPDGITVVTISSAEYAFSSYNPVTNTYSYSNTAVHGAGVQTKIKLLLVAECAVFDLLDNTSGSSLDITSDISFDYAISGIPYNLSGTTLSFNVAQANIKTTVSAFNLTITIPNDFDPFNQEVRYDIVGNSSLAEFSVYFDLPAGLAFNQIDSIKVNGVNVTGYSNPVLLFGSTYGVDLNAGALGLSAFSTGDVVLIYYNYTPDCLNSVQINYYSGIDCSGSPCFFENDLGFVNLYQAPPLIDVTVSNNSAADYCGNTSHFEMTIVNEDLSGYTMYNPQLFMILYNQNSYSNFQVNGEAIVTGLPSFTTGTVWFNLLAMQSSSGYVLEDYNGDGTNGEIAPGDTVIITFDLLLDTTSLANCPAPFAGNQFYGYLSYKQSVCITSPTITSSFFGDSYTNSNSVPPSVNVTGSVADGQNQVIEFCIDRQIIESTFGGVSQLLLDDQLLYGCEVILPCGMTLADPSSAVWEFSSGATIPVAVSSSPLGGGVLVDFQSTPGQIPITANHIAGCLVLETTYACDTCSSPAVITFNGFGVFEDCPTVQHWACESVSFCTDCEPVVACNTEGKIVHSNFEVNRTSFGWTNSMMTAKVTQADVDLNPTNYNTVGAYACDTIHVLLEGEICGGADDFTPFITFEKPAAITISLLNLVSAEMTINSTTSPITLASSTDQSGYWAFEFQSQSGPFPDGTTLALEAIFVVSKPVISSSAFPFHLISDFTGAFFTNTQWIGGASPATPGSATFFDNYGESCLYPEQEFNYYKVIQYLQEPVSSLNCGTNGETVKIRLGYQGGTSGDEFPNEFRPFNIFIDSVVFELTNPANVGNVFAVSSSIGFTPLITTQSGAFITLEPVGGIWPVIDKTNFLNYYSLEIEFDVNCANTDPITIFDNYVHYENYFYSDNACNDELSLSTSVIHPFNTPNLTYTFLNPVQDALTPNADFDFSVSNTSFFGTNFPYMLVTYDPLLVNVSVAGATYYTWSSNQIYIEVGTLPAFSTINDILTVTPLNCDVEQVTEVYIESGYHCKGYPAVAGTFDVADYCPQQNDTLQLTILKSNLNVDLFTSFSPEDPVDHCDGKFSILLQVYNDEKADITDLALQFSSIPGLTLLATSYYYPIPLGGSYDPSMFTWSMVDPMDFILIPPATGSALQTGYTFYNDGLDAFSTLNGILANDGINLYNFYQIKLDFIVDCDFDVTEELEFVISAITNCNEPITLTTSTFIDFIPPAENLEISMNILETVCDPLDEVNDIFIEVYNGDTVAYDSLYVDLYCDVDNDGIFDPNVDFFIGSQLLSVGGSTYLIPGAASTAGFSTSIASTCATGVFIASIANEDGCYCNYNHVIDTAVCCNCPDLSSATPLEFFLYDHQLTIYDDIYYYGITNFPTPLSNYTNDPTDPALYVFDLDSNDWVYPTSFNFPLCGQQYIYFLEFSAPGDTLIMQYSAIDIPLPHNIQAIVVYPPVTDFGDTCEVELPECLSKIACPICHVNEPEGCSYDGSFEFDEDILSAEVNDKVILNVYPNPFGNEISVNSSKGIRQVQLIDASGRVVIMSQFSDQRSLTLRTPEVSAGAYVMVLLFSDGEVHHTRIVRE